MPTLPDEQGTTVTATVVSYRKPGDLFSVLPEFEYIGKPSGVKLVLELVSEDELIWNEEIQEMISAVYRFAWDVSAIESSDWKRYYGAFNGRLHANTELGWYDAVCYLEVNGKIVLWHLTKRAFWIDR